MPLTYIQNEHLILTTRLPSQYLQTKPNITKQYTNFMSSNQNGTGQSFNRERPSSSIYQLNQYLDEKERPISIFRSGVEMGQKTYR